jgi:branched-chain amino acid transport system substrate-binding protein
MKYKLISIIFFVVLLSTYLATAEEIQKQTIKVGVILPLTGSAGSYGEQFKKGLEIANKKAGFKLVYEDSQFDSKTALTAYKKLIHQDKVQYLISFGGATCEVINREAQRDKILHIAAGCNTAEFLSTDSYNFRLDVNEEIAATKMAKYLKSQGVKSMALLSVNNSWAGTIIKFAEVAFRKENIKITDNITFEEKSAGNIRTELLKIKKQNPNRIFLISLPDLTPLVLKQLKELEIKIPIVSNISVENPVVVELSGEEAEGIIYLSVKENSESKTKKDFYSEFPEGNTFASWGYDSVSLIELASRSVEPRKRLQQLKDYVGAFNKYSFSVSGEINLPYEIKIIREGKNEHFSDL